MRNALRARFVLGDIAVEVSGGGPDLHAQMEAIWGLCVAENAPHLPIAATCKVQVRSLAKGRYRLLRSFGLGSARGTARLDVQGSDLLASLEGLVYAACDNASVLTSVHAGAVVAETGPLLFLGASNAGKSSLVCAGLDAGACFVSDDRCLTDGQRLFGVPRTPRFNPTREGEALPERLRALDHHSYTLRLQASEGVFHAHVPLRPVPRSQVWSEPLLLADMTLVLLSTATTPSRLWPVTSAPLKAELLRGVCGTGMFARALCEQPLYLCHWSDPSEAYAQLLAAEHKRISAAPSHAPRCSRNDASRVGHAAHVGQRL